MPDWLTALIAALRHEPGLAVPLLMAAGFSLFGFDRFLRLQKRRRLIEDTPTSRIRSAAQGYVELEGYVKAPNEKPLYSPLTHTACVWYRFEVEERNKDDRSTTSWSTVRSGTSTHLFLLDDHTGECVVDPEKALVEPAYKRVWQAGDYRYTEELILPNEHLYALGWLKSYDPMHASPNEWIRDTIVAWKHDPQKRREFDTNRDGQLDADEFEALRKAATNAAMQEFNAEMLARSVQGQTHLLNAGDPSGRPLLLSSHPQRMLAKRLRLHAWLWLGGALILLGGLLYFVVHVLPKNY